MQLEIVLNQVLNKFNFDYCDFPNIKGWLDTKIEVEGQAIMAEADAQEKAEALARENQKNGYQAQKKAQETAQEETAVMISEAVQASVKEVMASMKSEETPNPYMMAPVFATYGIAAVIPIFIFYQLVLMI